MLAPSGEVRCESIRCFAPVLFWVAPKLIAALRRKIVGGGEPLPPFLFVAKASRQSAGDGAFLTLARRAAQVRARTSPI